MAKLPRTTQKIFGKNAPENQITTFGSIKAGTPVYTQSASQIMNANFEEGWSAAVEDDYAPYRQDRNAVDTALTQQLAYLFQEGIPEWDAGTTYYKGSVVKVVNGNALTFYKSIADNNTASVNTTASWHKMLDINASNQIVSPSINTPTISGGSMSNGTFANPTFSGTVNVPLASQSSSTDSTIAASIGWANNPSLSSNIVHKTGNETIQGTKTFLQRIQKSSKIDPTSTTGLVEVQALSILDKNGKVVGLYNTSRSATTNTNQHRVTNSNVSGGNWYDLSVSVTDDGIGYASCASAGAVNNMSMNAVTNSTSSNYIPTMGWVNNPATSTNVVHRTGNETIAGDKDFTGTLTNDSKYILNNSFLMPSDSGAVMLTAGTSSAGGAYFRLYGKDHSDGAGQFVLATTDGENTKALTGKPDGTLTWNGNNISNPIKDASINGKVITLTKADGSTTELTTQDTIGLTATQSKSSNGYVKFSNGIIIQWGYSSSFGTDSKITFPTAFSSETSFTVIVTIISSTAYGYPTYIKSQTATNFTGRRNDSNKPATHWLAIGY